MSAKTKPAPAEFTGVRADTENLPRLRDITDAENILDAFLVETEGEETPELAELKEALQGDTAAFFERWGLWLKSRKAEVKWLTGQAAPFREEADRILDRAKALEAAIERSERRLLYEMQLRELPAIEGKLVTIKRQLNPPAVVGAENLTPEDLMALYLDSETAKFVRYKPESYELDKAVVKQTVGVDLLPTVLIEKGVGTEQAEKVVVK
jgi:hypothetical protein